MSVSQEATTCLNSMRLVLCDHVLPHMLSHRPVTCGGYLLALLSSSTSCFCSGLLSLSPCCSPLVSLRLSLFPCFFFPYIRFNSISFTGARGVPDYTFLSSSLLSLPLSPLPFPCPCLPLTSWTFRFVCERWGWRTCVASGLPSVSASSSA